MGPHTNNIKNEPGIEAIIKEVFLIFIIASHNPLKDEIQNPNINIENEILWLYQSSINAWVVGNIGARK